MYEITVTETRIYAPAENVENKGYPQLSIHDTGWTEKEREQMRFLGFDGMDMLRAWLD